MLALKRFVAASVLATVAVFLCYGDDPVKESEGNTVRFTFADQEIIVSLVQNSATRSLVGMLPLELKFEDYAGTEKISYLRDKLDLSDVPEGYDPSVGDLTLFAPWGKLAFFYRDHAYAGGLIPLGAIVAGLASLSELDRAGAVRVEIAE